MLSWRAINMTYRDDYEDQEWYDDDRSFARPPITQQALDWGISGSILAVLILTVLYVLSPVDFIPDVFPVAGQVDDIAAILAGSGSISFLVVVRLVLRSRVGRWGCLLAILLTATGAFVIFWALMRILDSVL
jgi:hypothetical protein